MSESAAGDEQRSSWPAQSRMRELLAARNPAVYVSNKIGDSILTLPTLRALGEMFTAPLTLICATKTYELFLHEISPRYVDSTGIADEFGSLENSFDFDTLASQLGAIDVLINAVPWRFLWNVDVASLRRHLAPTTSIGFPYDDDVYDIVIEREPMHSADEIFLLAQLFDRSAQIETYARPLPVAPEVQQRVQAMRASLPDGAKVLAVHADSALWAKQWSVTRFIALLDRFLSRHRDYVAWVVGMGHEDLNVGRERDRVHSYLGQPLDLSMGMVAAADLFVGVDSCMLHVADLARVPGVGLFGPMPSWTWGFRFGPHRHLDGRRRIRDLTVNEVLAPLEELAEEHT